MSNIAKLQKAIDANIDSLKSLYDQTTGLKGAIADAPEEKKPEYEEKYSEVMDTFDKHVATTNELIKALKRALAEEA